MIQLKSITKVYQTKESVSVTALDGVSIAFRPSEFVSVLGPSGCGKTTMLNLIGGLDSYTDGELVVAGKSTAEFTDGEWDSYRNDLIGFVFQSYNLIMHLSVLQNVELALTLSGADAATRKYKAMEALERVGLANHLRKKPSELSGGEMQRVAIARAIVNDPAVILADEPTGALDSKNSVQIMELLKDISRDRLVIMVTHNDALAATYSTRIVKLSDGKITSDSAPYNPEKEQEKTEQNRKNNKKAGGKKSAKNNENTSLGDKKTHTSMSFGVALSLSFRNLMTKKTRTALTSLAASIGIIGLALVLALFNGLNVFLDKVQYDTLSSYPMTVATSTTTDYTEYIAVITDSANYKSDPNMKDKIFVSHLMTKLREATVSNKITEDYLNYVKAAPSEYLRDVGYYYGTGMNVFKSKVEVTSDKLAGLNLTNNSILLENVWVQTSSYFKQLVGDKDFILSQYDLVAGKYPESKEELVLVLDKNNQITDAMLTAFLMDVNATQKDESGNFLVNSYEYDDFLGALNEDGSRKTSKYGTFTLALNNGLYGNENLTDFSTESYSAKLKTCEDALKSKYGGFTQSYIDSVKSALGVSGLPACYAGEIGNGKTLELKIVGIIRLNEQTTTGSMGVYPIGYTSELTEYINEQNKNSAVVKAQLKEIEKLYDGDDGTVCYNVLNSFDKEGNKLKITSESAAINQLKALGYAELPLKIEFYAKDFDSKLKLKEYLAAYNDKEGVTESIYVTDLASTVIDVLKTFIDAITGILLALTAISLLVAAIMIAIITYVSVIERTREIGVLRAIGARKIDVTLVFNAETVIIGLASGVLGVLLALLLQIPLNALLFDFSGIASLAVLSPAHALILVGVSILVTLVAGMVPSVMAAHRDPVKALRSE